MDSTPLAQWGAWIRFYFHLDPNILSEDELIERWAELRFCLVSLEKMEP